MAYAMAMVEALIQSNAIAAGMAVLVVILTTMPIILIEMQFNVNMIVAHISKGNLLLRILFITSSSSTGHCLE